MTLLETRTEKLVIGLIILLVGIICIVAIVAGVNELMSDTPQAAFNATVTDIVDNCTRANVRASAIVANGVAIPNKQVNADGILRCLYASGVTLVHNGDPVHAIENAAP